MAPQQRSPRFRIEVGVSSGAASVCPAPEMSLFSPSVASFKQRWITERDGLIVPLGHGAMVRYRATGNEQHLPRTNCSTTVRALADRGPVTAVWWRFYVSPEKEGANRRARHYEFVPQLAETRFVKSPRHRRKPRQSSRPDNVVELDGTRLHRPGQPNFYSLASVGEP